MLVNIYSDQWGSPFAFCLHLNNREVGGLVLCFCPHFIVAVDILIEVIIMRLKGKSLEG